MVRNRRTHIDITNYPQNIDYGILTTKQIETFDAILDAVKNQKSTISCPAYSLKEKHEIITHIGLYLGTIENIEYLITWNKNNALLNLELFEKLLNDKIIIDARIDEAVSTLREGSDKYKLRQISDYVARKIVYTKEYRDTISALDGKGVCGSYTMLFYKMATRLGIKTYTCYGYSNAYHAWNMVELNGKYMYYDITFYDNPMHYMFIHMESSHIENFQINNKWSSDLKLSINNNTKTNWREKMTVYELKKRLEQYDDNLIVMIPDANWTPDKSWFPFVCATGVARGVNEDEGCLFIDNYVEGEDE